MRVADLLTRFWSRYFPLFAVLASASTPSLAAPEASGEGRLREKLNLAQAESIALRYAPEISAAYFDARAAEQRIREERAAFFPQITGEVAAVGTGNSIQNAFGGSHTASNNTRLGATGGLNDPTVLSREANGVTISQLITDFGRTWNLTAAAKLEAVAARDNTYLARGRVLLSVDDAYFHALQAKSLLRVAQETVSARQGVYSQAAALVKSQLKSELDLSFARVALGEAKLLELQARNALDEACAALSAALGYRQPRVFELRDEPAIPMPPEALSDLTSQALQLRPELLSLRAQVDAARRIQAAEREAAYPRVVALGALGRTPSGDPQIQGNYSAAGVVVELPLITGGRLSARYQEAEFHADAIGRRLASAEDQVVQSVNSAWLEANAAQERIGVTADLLASAREAQRLAQSRYLIGVTSIVELQQAQLSAIQAELGAASAKYDYQIARMRLEFEIGALKFRTPRPAVRRDSTSK